MMLGYIFLKGSKCQLPLEYQGTSTLSHLEPLAEHRVDRHHTTCFTVFVDIFLGNATDYAIIVLVSSHASLVCFHA